MRVQSLASIFVTASALAALALTGCGPKAEEGTTPTTGNGAPATAPEGAASTQGNATEGKVVFQNNCAGCHGADGKGKMEDQPDFTDSAWHARHDDEEVRTAIRDGHEKMPAFKDKLSAEQINDVMAYIRSFAKEQPGQ